MKQKKSKLKTFYPIRCILVLIVATFWNDLYAQTRLQLLESSQRVQIITRDGKVLKHAFAGGMNQPQFSHLDLNNDGTDDLVVYDRTCSCFTGYLREQNQWEYAPQYLTYLPKVKEGFALFKDYNGDGKKDLFFKSIFSMGVYKNISAFGEKAKFKLVDGNIQAYNFYPPPLDSNGIEVGKLNIPSISDLDNDGDIDILALNTFGQGIQYFLNNVIENQLSLEKLSFELPDDCWGNFEEGSTTNAINLQRGMFCPGTVYRYKKHIGGSSLLTLDYDSDGDMDLLLGNAGFSNLIYLENGKSDFALDVDSMISYDTSFPSSDDRADIETFPAAYLIDIDGNETKDLVVTVNLSDKSSGVFHERDQVICFPNSKKNAFELSKSIPFLTDMIFDLGGFSKPTLVDIDTDGDLDIVVASNGDYGITKDSSDRLALLINVSDKQNIKFKIEDENFGELSTYNLQKVAPSFGDIDDDGDKDMIIGRKQGDLWYFENVGDSLQANFVLKDTLWKGIDIGAASAPTLFDYNEDGLLDLFIGEYEGNINYYENIGSKELSKFELSEDSIFGLFVNEYRSDVNPPGFAQDGYSCPTLAKDEEQIYFLSGAASGAIFTDTGQVYFSSDSDSIKFDFGWNSHPVLGDINNDGCMDMLVGHARGGLYVYLGFCKNDTIGINTAFNDNHIELFPNPSNGEIFIRGLPEDIQKSYTIYSIIGRKVYESDFYQNKITLPSLQTGVYLIKFSFRGQSFFKKLVLNSQ